MNIIFKKYQYILILNVIFFLSIYCNKNIKNKSPEHNNITTTLKKESGGFRLFSSKEQQTNVLEEQNTKTTKKNKSFKGKLISQIEHFVHKMLKKTGKLKDKITRYNIKKRYKEIYLENLPKELDGLKVGVISDIHITFLNEDQIKKMINTFIYKDENTKKLEKIDIIVHGGDLINYNTSELTTNKKKILSELEKHYPKRVYSIFGNHDFGTYKYMSLIKKNCQKNIDFLENEYKKMKKIQKDELNWKLLDNEYDILEINKKKVKIVGISQMAYCSTLENIGNIDQALKTPYKNSSIDITNKYNEYNHIQKTDTKADFVILLSHDPSTWVFTQNSYKFHFTISGHTHGSHYTAEYDFIDSSEKFKFLKSPKKTTDTYTNPKPGLCFHSFYSGDYEDNDGNVLYVDNGAGFSGTTTPDNKNEIYTDRGGIDPEVTIITLISKKK